MAASSEKPEGGSDGSATQHPPTSDQGKPSKPSAAHRVATFPLVRKTNTTSSSKKKGPAGGFDDTPIPHAPPGFTVKITFHRATNLPLADINTLSADPFIVAVITTALPQRHKIDPPLTLRTPTVRESTNPEWNVEWIVANVPPSGFRMKCRIFDEDPADHDDRLGNAHIDTGPLDEEWAGIKNQGFPVKMRMASKRAYLLRGVAVCLGKVEHMRAALYVSVEVLGRTEDEEGGRCYTVGPQYWIRHYSPLLGRLLGQKEPREDGEVSRRTGKPKPERYNFQANQMQLRGPVPGPMYHRYVEFKPFVKQMFTATGVRGFILSKALHAQHARVYNFDQSTAYERVPSPCIEFTQKFLELCHWDRGGRIFTYVLTLDALFRFTETGKEFGIDMLSKHTMHSDVAPYVAFSGEFFIRRWEGRDEEHGEKGEKGGLHPHFHALHHHAHHINSNDNQHNEHASEDGADNKKHKHSRSQSSGAKSWLSALSSNRSHNADKEEEKQMHQDNSPHHYELIIDNDSGTYRPNPSLLPLLHDFLSANFPGLHIRTLDCQAQAEEMAALKKQQRERKQKEGQRIVFTQARRATSLSSLSSSDESMLDRMEAAVTAVADGARGGKGEGSGKKDGQQGKGDLGYAGPERNMSALEEQTHLRHRVLREAEERVQAAKRQAKEYNPRGVKAGWKGVGRGNGEGVNETTKGDGNADIDGEEHEHQEDMGERPPPSTTPTTAPDTRHEVQSQSQSQPQAQEKKEATG
ncbi:uncharacterized protein EI97DRAFT_428800 [Westerdykella ornata]|uniref:C2 domain-containing protein n=1 Tax=Westerdykella ornata TaxID=318751 RepID=A0A6A6JWB2_WESOR|nr:uncharacterized protein EI97DRAFT_428800 [Westerdykella ornata]KAF2280697.1 hypothetical protein EI97DRAFT_428800 [Westerdykella ornata]